MVITETFNKLIDLYDIKGEMTDSRKIVNGHINETYCVTIAGVEYIFQKVNNYVFKDPVVVMKNIQAVSNHIENNKKNGCCKIVKFIDNKYGKNYAVIDDEFWRICKYECNTVTFDVVENISILRSAGYAFGDFLNVLSDLPIEKLFVTIPDFHNTRKRLDDFFSVVEADPIGRANDVKADIEVFEEYREFCNKLNDMSDQGLLPLRPVHNDTKYNNILLDKDTFKPVCVIDLDTIMPGLTAHDFGDAIRFACNKAPEDETDLSKVYLDLDYYKEFTRGFMDAAKRFMTDLEIETLAYGAPTITLELASRFLADHINGDKYFRIHRPNHNLERARCQIQLAKDMFKKFDEMCEFVKSCK